MAITSKTKNHKKSLLGMQVKFSKVQAIALAAVVVVVGIVAFALTHAAAYPAHITIYATGGPTNQQLNFLSGPNPYDNNTHDVGTCLRSFYITGGGSIQCDGNTIGPVSITAPDLRGSGYTFGGWTGCDGTSPSGASCNIQGYTNNTKYISAHYSAATTPPPAPVATTGKPATLAFTLDGLPAGTAVGFTSTGHDIGDCARSWTVTQGSTKTCSSGPNGTGGYFGLGTSAGDTLIHWPKTVQAGGKTYVEYQYCGGSTGRGGCNTSSTDGTPSGINQPAGEADSMTVYYTIGGTGGCSGSSCTTPTPTPAPTPAPVAKPTPSPTPVPTATVTTPNATAGPGQTVNTGGQIAVGSSASTVTPTTVASLPKTGSVICAGSCSTSTQVNNTGTQVNNTGGKVSVGNSQGNTTPPPAPSIPQTITTTISSPFVGIYNFFKGVFHF